MISLRCLTAVVLLFVHLPLTAATFVVNSFFDGPDADPGDGVCATADPGPPRCTLRAAIMEMNEGSASLSNSIEFSVNRVPSGCDLTRG